MVRSRVLLSAIVAVCAIGLAGCDETGVYSCTVMSRRSMPAAITARPIMAAAIMAAAAIIGGYGYRGGVYRRAGYYNRRLRALRRVITADIHGGGLPRRRYRGGGFHGGGYHGGGFHGGGDRAASARAAPR